jgi:hypothetical protein
VQISLPLAGLTTKELDGRLWQMCTLERVQRPVSSSREKLECDDHPFRRSGLDHLEEQPREDLSFANEESGV